jgi:hypothetical protein
MTNPPQLAEDIAYAISCIQDYRDTVDIGNEDREKLWDDISRRIERLFKFYYQLVALYRFLRQNMTHNIARLFLVQKKIGIIV